MTSDPLARACAAFEAAFGVAPTRAFRAPGRVNLIGEHTDYNDGFVLPCAINRCTVIACGPADDALIYVVAADLDDRDAFVPALPMAHGKAGWANYVRGVAAELLGLGQELAPLRLAIAGDVPRGAGLSSSASLEVATALALTEHTLDPVEVALLSQRAENNFVGCACGIMDQLVSAAAEPGHALLIDCHSLERRPVPLPPGLALVVIDSGIRHEHLSGDYNARRAECERAARHYGVAALRDVDEVALLDRADGLDPVAFRRARHVVTENARVLAAADALAAGDIVAMGALMAASHRSMRDDFDITVPAIDLIVELADQVIAGNGGARMTGGGFGGSVIALVPIEHADALQDHIAKSYRPPGGDAPAIAVFLTAGGAGPLEIMPA